MVLSFVSGEEAVSTECNFVVRDAVTAGMGTVGDRRANMWKRLLGFAEGSS